jgi:hypothetical protein
VQPSKLESPLLLHQRSDPAEWQLPTLPDPRRYLRRRQLLEMQYTPQLPSCLRNLWNLQAASSNVLVNVKLLMRSYSINEKHAGASSILILIPIPRRTPYEYGGRYVLDYFSMFSYRLAPSPLEQNPSREGTQIQLCGLGRKLVQSLPPVWQSAVQNSSTFVRSYLPTYLPT